MPKLICISGPSGCGKSTITKFLKNLLPNNSVISLSGDDLHKWERGDINWKQVTPLNPMANNLNKGYDDIRDLLARKPITRKRYNHGTGTFGVEEIVESADVIIYEGLHTLFDKRILALADLTIYINTEKKLRTKWKIRRDIAERGYTEEEVLKALKQRDSDENFFITPQRKNADTIITLTEHNNIVTMCWVSLNSWGQELMRSLEQCYKSKN